MKTYNGPPAPSEHTASTYRRTHSTASTLESAASVSTRIEEAHLVATRSHIPERYLAPQVGLKRLPHCATVPASEGRMTKELLDPPFVPSSRPPLAAYRGQAMRKS